VPVTPKLPAHAALFLDLDGTLLDIAPTPSSVVVPPELPDVLHRVRTLVGDALAIVTGRSIAEIDGLLGDAPYAVAGEHGAAIRPEPGTEPVRTLLPHPPRDWALRAADAVVRHNGALLEMKQQGFVLHYRLAPDAKTALYQAAEAIVGDRGADFVLLPAHMAWEVKPRGVDKGTALAALMQQAPFRGRTPVYVGDDVTDEDAIRAAEAAGGVGFRVADTFGTPGGVRNWLAELAAAPGGPSSA
jgi:trehalose 6-phosphate phosphatase